MARQLQDVAGIPGGGSGYLTYLSDCKGLLDATPELPEVRHGGTPISGGNLG